MLYAVSAGPKNYPGDPYGPSQIGVFDVFCALRYRRHDGLSTVSSITIPLDIPWVCKIAKTFAGVHRTRARLAVIVHHGYYVPVIVYPNTRFWNARILSSGPTGPLCRTADIAHDLIAWKKVWIEAPHSEAYTKAEGKVRLAADASVASMELST